MYNELEAVVEKEIRPYLRAHHGDVEIVDFKDGVLKVRMLGGCSGCPSAQYTLEDVVEKELKKRFPFIDSVVIADNISEEMWALARKILKSGQKETNRD